MTYLSVDIAKMKKRFAFLENKWVREILLFLVLFIIAIINDREDIVSPHELKDSIFVFIVLYVHLQVQRFLVLPYLLSKKYWVYGVVALVVILVFSFVAYLLDSWLVGVGWYDEFPGNHGLLFVYYLLSFLLSVAALLLVFFIIAFYKQEKRALDQRLALQDMELKLLRTQLEPHFLFNSLNNLYGISLEKPEQVPDRIMQISQILRYHLEQSKKRYIALEEDLEFLSYFIANETDRLGDRCKVLFKNNIDSSLYLSDYRIAPMILMGFVENTFKHVGLSKDSTQGFIAIEIGLNKGVLLLKTKNSIKRSKQHVESTKIGLNASIQILNLLYEGDYTLEIKETDTYYESSVSICLI